MLALLWITESPACSKHLFPAIEGRIREYGTLLESDLDEKRTIAVRSAIKELRWMTQDLLNEASLKENLANEKVG